MLIVCLENIKYGPVLREWFCSYYPTSLVLLCVVLFCLFFSHRIISPSVAGIDSSRVGSDLTNALPVDSPSVFASDVNNAGCSSTKNADEPVVVETRVVWKHSFHLFCLWLTSKLLWLENQAGVV